MWLGAGLLVAPAVGAAAGGWWLLAGVVLAGVLALCSAGSVPAGPSANWLTQGTRVAARLAGASLFASVFAAYLFPWHARLAAVAFVLVVTVLAASGLSLPRYWRSWLLGILLVAAAALVAVCLAVPPVSSPGGMGPGTTGKTLPGVSGAFAAGAAVFPLLARRRRSWWLAGSVAVTLAVCAAELYQLGPVRLGLSPAPVTDVLAAADGQVLVPLLAGVVVIATVPAALLALAGAGRASGAFPRTRWPAIGCGLLAAAGAALLHPASALWLAAALALADVLVTSLLAVSRRRDARSILCAALAISLLAWAPPFSLLLAVALIGLIGAALAALRSSGRTRRPSRKRRKKIIS
jgi:hypothetical protein